MGILDLLMKREDQKIRKYLLEKSCKINTEEPSLSHNQSETLNPSFFSGSCSPSPSCDSNSMDIINGSVTSKMQV